METRICKYCEIEYSIDFFEKAAVVKGKTYRRWSCGDCRKIEKSTISQQKREWFNSVKEKLYCKECGEDRHYMLDFHHRDPDEKEGNISTRVASWGKKRLLAEIKKCDIYCANHHRELHYLEKIKKWEKKEYLIKRQEEQ